MTMKQKTYNTDLSAESTTCIPQAQQTVMLKRDLKM